MAKPRMQDHRIKTVWVSGETPPLEEDYIKGQQIGEPGQFGKAFRVTKKDDKKTLAVKQISKDRFYRLDRSARRRQALLRAMQAEIDIMKRLSHKYIVNLESVYEDKHNLWLVMEECRGGELFDRITKRKRFTEPDAAHVLKMVLEALYYMHDRHRVVHCDLKPDNILFVDDREDSEIKIIDFGMSKVLPRLRSLQELCGTPYYTAPEIIEGAFAHEADLWSVGVIMFVMLFGYPPFYVNPSKYYGRAESEAIYALIKKGFNPKVKNGYGPWYPKRFPASPEAMDLMTHLMETDRAKRMNAKEALMHPWIKSKGVTDFWTKKKGNKAPEQKDEETAVSKELFTQIATFSNNCNFKLAVVHMFRKQFEQMRPAHFKHLKEVFERLDTDKSGTIDLEEFEKGMLEMKELNLTKERIHEMFAELDVKSVGEIQFQELVNAAVHDFLVSSDERLYHAFREMDLDDDGIITMDELKTMLKKIDPYGHHLDIAKVIDDADLDKNGQIDYEEFLRALHPDFNEPPSWFWNDKQ